MRRILIKKAISYVLTFSLCLGNVLPVVAVETTKTESKEQGLVSVMSNTNEIVEEGECGEGVAYTLDSSGLLIISGEGSVEPRNFNGKGIKQVVIENGVTGIEDKVFLECRYITSVEIPSTVTEMGNWVFAGCTSLTSINVAEENTVYDSRNESNAIIEKKSNKLIYGCKNTKIPESVTAIGSNAFYQCSSLESIEIPSTVTSIGEWAFFGCSSLTSLEIPEGVTSIGESAFNGCAALKSIEIPSGVTSIGQQLFYKCHALECVTIPSGVTSIADEAFYECAALKSIEIPSTVVSIGKWCFYGNGITSIEIPEGVKSIGERAFRECTHLTSIKIPSTVESIGDWVFYKCSSLISIVVDEDNKVYDSRENCNAIIEVSNNKLVYGCKNTKIPLGVTSIGFTAFAGCSGLTSIEIPEEVTSIGECAFLDDNNLIICSTIDAYAYTYAVQNGITWKEIKVLLEDLSISLETNEYVYDGVAKEPAVTVMNGTHLLDSTDYTVEYANNVNSGTATVIITGLGKYSGKVTSEFIIKPADITEVTLDTTEYVYDGEAKEPSVEVMSGTTLLDATEYTVEYTDNVNAGTATVTITGKGNYTGTVTRTFSIKAATKPEEKPTEPQVEAPSKVKSLKQKASYSTKAITLTWNKVAGAEGYEVYRATSKNGKYTKVTSVTKTSYKDSKLKAGKTYYYKICAYKTVDRSKLCGDYSAVVAAGTQTVKPSLKVTAGKKKATLTWKKVSGADGYELQMSTSKNGKFSKIKTANAKTVKYTKSKLTKGKKYYFKMRTYRTVGGKKIYSSWSAAKSVKVK